MKIRAHHLGAEWSEGLGGALGGVETGEKTQSSSAVDVATRSRGVTSNTTAAGSHDTGTNSFNTVEGAEVEVRNNSSNLRSKEKGIISTSLNMVDVETLVDPTRRGVRQFDSRDETTATSNAHPPRDYLSTRGRGRGTTRNRGGNRVTHREKFTCSKRPGEPPKEGEEGKYPPPGGEANNRSETVDSPVARARRATEGKKQHNSPPEGEAKQKRRRAKQHKAPEGKATPPGTKLKTL